jgi:hypothetical protein
MPNREDDEPLLDVLGDGSGLGLGRFTLVEDLGCGITFLGFVLFLAVALILLSVLF